MNPGTPLVPKCGLKIYLLLYKIILFLEKLNLLKKYGTQSRKNLTTCSKSANKSSTSCVRTACYKLSTSLEQAVNNLKQPCSYCQNCYKVVPTRLLQSWYNNIATILCCQPCNILVMSWLYQTCWKQPCNKSDNAIKLVTSC